MKNRAKMNNYSLFFCISLSSLFITFTVRGEKAIVDKELYDTPFPSRKFWKTLYPFWLSSINLMGRGIPLDLCSRSPFC